jgi:hypothetical protein
MNDLQSNADAPAATDLLGIKQFIADRESSIDRISIELLKEEARVSNCADAIRDLELAISQRTTALEAHEKYIAALDLIQSRTKEQGTVAPAQESRSRALHRGRVRSSSRTAYGSGTVDDEIEVAQRELQELRCSLSWNWTAGAIYMNYLLQRSSHWLATRSNKKKFWKRGE